MPAKSSISQPIEHPPLEVGKETRSVATPERKFDDTTQANVKRRQRNPLFGRRPPTIPIRDDYSDSDSDPFNDDDPEDEINFESELAEVRHAIDVARHRPDLPPPHDQFLIVSPYKELPLVPEDTRESLKTIRPKSATDMPDIKMDDATKSESEPKPHPELLQEPDAVSSLAHDMDQPPDHQPPISENSTREALLPLTSTTQATIPGTGENEEPQQPIRQFQTTDYEKLPLSHDKSQLSSTAPDNTTTKNSDAVVTATEITSPPRASYSTPWPSGRSQSPSEGLSHTIDRPTEIADDIHPHPTAADLILSNDQSVGKNISNARTPEEIAPKDDASKYSDLSGIQPPTIKPSEIQSSTAEASLLPNNNLDKVDPQNGTQEVTNMDSQTPVTDVPGPERLSQPLEDHSKYVMEPPRETGDTNTSTEVPLVFDEASNFDAEMNKKSEAEPIHNLPPIIDQIDTEVLPDAQAPEDDSLISPKTNGPIQRLVAEESNGDHPMGGVFPQADGTDGTDGTDGSTDLETSIDKDNIGNSEKEIYPNKEELNGTFNYERQQIPSPVPQPPELTMEVPGETDEDEDEAEQAGYQLLRQELVQQQAAIEQQQAALEEDRQLRLLETIKHPRDTKTPPLESLPRFDYNKWEEDPEFLSTLDQDSETESALTNFIEETIARRWREKQEAGKVWSENYMKYRRFTDFDMDPIAVRSREVFKAARNKEAGKETTEKGKSAISSDLKAEGQRRTGSRFATDHDIERVLRESEREAKESEEQQEQDAREHTANSKEATIPDMFLDEEYKENMFWDTTHKIPFERSFRMLAFGESIDNFTEEEARVFQDKYYNVTKQFAKIAESLPRRDYKACIQHYYIVKKTDAWKAAVKAKKGPVKTGRRKGAKKPTVAITNIKNGGGDETEATPDVENGNERRRPRRAAAPTWNFEAPTSTDNEGASPAPTPAKKVATPKGETNGESAPTKRKPKVPREKAPKQPKASQLLAAAPSPVSRDGDSPAPPLSTIAPEPAPIRPPIVPTRFPPHENPSPQQLPTFPPTFTQPVRDTPTNLEVPLVPERIGSAPPPASVESQPDRRTAAQQQTSSYWSVPEVTDFPGLLRHFGTDWIAIARHMGSKTHTMVYKENFSEWLKITKGQIGPKRQANIAEQVKNYYQRSVDSGNKREWEQIARDADSKRGRGESTGPAPTPTAPSKRRYDPTPTPLSRSASAMDLDELSASQPIVLRQTSPPQPSLSTRFPALAQAGPVPQSMNQTITPNSLPSNRSHHQANQQSLSQISQQQQQQQQQPVSAPPLITTTHLQPQPQQMQSQQIRQSRGPALGFFTTDSSRSTMQNTLSQQSQNASPISDPVTAASQRSAQVAEEAALERQKALKHEEERMSREQRQAIKQLAIQEHQKNIREQAIRDQTIRDQALLRDQAIREQQQQAYQLQQQVRDLEVRANEQLQQKERDSKQDLERNLKRKQERDHEQREREQHDRKEKRERNFHLKQEEIEARNPQQYEVYSGHSSRTGSMAPTRPEATFSTVPTTDVRRQAPPSATHQQYPPRNQGVRNLLSDGMGAAQNIVQTSSPAFGRPGISTPPIQEQFSTPPPPPAAVNNVRQQDTPRKTSNIMSLLNDDSGEPSRPPAQAQSKRSGVTSAVPAQSSRTPPPPHHSLQTSRYPSHPSQTLQQSQHTSQQMQPSQHLQQASHQVPSQTNPQHGYSQPPSQSMHQHSSSVGRSYTPTTPYEGRSHVPPSAVQHHPMYPQSTRPPIGSQSSSIRREPLNEMNAPGGYTRSPITKINESPYSATPPPVGQQMARQPMSSPHDLAQTSDRELYSRQSQFAVPQQPSSGVDFHSASSSHRSVAFGQSGHRTPPTRGQWISTHQVGHHVHNSRQNSFDARNYNAGVPSAPTQQGYAQAPPQHIQYQQQQNQERFDQYEREQRERERQDREREQYYRSRDDPRDPRR